MDSKKVFISYSDDSREHAARVEGLAASLRRDGVDCRIDQYVKGSPPEGWRAWMKRTLKWADKVLIVCTKTYLRRLNKEEQPGKGYGATYEANLIAQELYQAHLVNERFIAVVFEPDDRKHIPQELRDSTSYLLEGQSGYDELLVTLTGRHKRPPALGDVKGVQREQAESSVKEPVHSRLIMSAEHFRGEAPETPSGVRLVRTLRGHADWIGRIAFSPNGRLLASPSEDRTVRLWDVETGECLHTLEGHSDTVISVAFDPGGRTLATASDDKTVRLWEVDSGRSIRILKEHASEVKSVSFDLRAGTLASGSADGKVALWEPESGRLLSTLPGHSDEISGVAFDPQGRTLASVAVKGPVRLWEIDGNRLSHLKGLGGFSSVAFDPQGRTLAGSSSDVTLGLWDTKSRRLIRTLEGHTGFVVCVAFLFDGRLVASKSMDHTVRLWNTHTGACLAAIPEPASSFWPPGLSFHPSRPWLATVGSDPHTPESERDRVIHIWQLDVELLLSEALSPVSYTTARIVLVGNQGVGKTGLGWRMARGEFKEHASTHGQQFWPLPAVSETRDDGTRCEAVLWDLAGQPDYRLIHALHLDDADLALILFDPTESHDPLRGVKYWLKQLNVAQAGGWFDSDSRLRKEEPTQCPALLVAARCDLGTGTLTEAELDAFCIHHGLRGHLATSAKKDIGIGELFKRMKGLIDWDDMPATVTNETFKRIKDYVLKLKENPERKNVVVTKEDLRRLLESTEKEWAFTDEELLTAVGHLETHGYVKRLRTKAGETRILLSPELLNNLAASFVLEARRNVKGLGSLEEEKLLGDQYPFSELDGLTEEERAILVDSATQLFLEHHVCFRETSPLTRKSYLVFPELINQKKPPLGEEEPTVEGVAYTLAGAVENVYASLVALLGYTQTFTRTNQWRDEARYEIGNGLVCGFRQETERDGELDLGLYFGVDVSQPIRTLFQGLFESFLARHNLTVHRFEPVVCSMGHALHRAVVREQARDGSGYAFCSRCGEKLRLPRADEPIQLTRQQQEEVLAQRRIADQRTSFEQAVFRVLAYVDETGKERPTCFISYAWGEREHERWVERNLATDLQKAGLRVALDRWENARIGSNISRFVERIDRCDRVIVVGTPLYRKKYDNDDPMSPYVVAAEGDLIGKRMIGTEAEKGSVLPTLLAGTAKTSFPSLLQGRVYADFRDPESYFLTAFDLILSLYGISPNDPAVADLREGMSREF